METVYSGATSKLSDEAQMLGDDMLAAYVFDHYNWKYIFLRPTVNEIVEAYLKLCTGQKRLRRKRWWWRRERSRRGQGRRRESRRDRTRSEPELAGGKVQREAAASAKR